MTKAEMIAFIDMTIEQTKSRGIAAQGVTKARLRNEFRALLEVRAALNKYVPGEQSAPHPQPSLF